MRRWSGAPRSFSAILDGRVDCRHCPRTRTPPPPRLRRAAICLNAVPWVDDGNSALGEVYDIAGDNGKTMAQGSRRNEGINGRHRSRPARREATPLVGDRRIDRQDPVVEPVGNLNFQPGSDTLSPPSSGQLSHALANFAECQDTDEKCSGRDRVEPVDDARIRPPLHQFRQGTGIDEVAHRSTSRAGDRSRSRSNSSPTNGDLRRNATNDGFRPRRRS